MAVALSVLAVFTLVACDADETVTTKKVNIVTTGDAGYVSYYSCKIRSSINLESLTGEAKNYGIRYGKAADADDISISTEQISGSEFEISLDSLEDGTTYYYRAYVNIGGTYHYGETKQFTTKTLDVSVVTLDATDITPYEARLGGSIVVPQNVGLTLEYGIEFTSNLLDIETFAGPNEINGYDFYCDLSGLSEETTYYYRAVAFVNGKRFEGETKQFTTESFTPEAIDLGLPSGTQWASCNIGTYKPEGYGHYYGWGHVYTDEDYAEAECDYYGLSTTILAAYDIIAFDDDSQKYNLTSQTDMASYGWKSSWRLPTYNDVKELIDNCDFTVAELNGVGGYKVVSRQNGNSIFLPFAGHKIGTKVEQAGEIGYYWSSSIEPTEANLHPYSLSLQAGKGVAFSTADGCYVGHSVRAVK